ncbi:MAG TPA: CocE/NonD family hydrolase [Steroidobacteraceae bacterium]|jgi:predicted acyl esterase|nr:CocE/NonD family hydrolase [Steroidobacteraceae bacterium]
MKALRLSPVMLCVLAVVGVATASEMNDVPAEVKDAVRQRDYTLRDVMIPMRDGVKLHTLIFVPNGAKDAPILMNRTPYDAVGRSTCAASTATTRRTSVLTSSGSCASWSSRRT